MLSAELTSTALLNASYQRTNGLTKGRPTFTHTNTLVNNGRNRTYKPQTIMGRMCNICSQIAKNIDVYNDDIYKCSLYNWRAYSIHDFLALLNIDKRMWIWQIEAQFKRIFI